MDNPTQHKILLIEDNINNLKLLEKYFQKSKELGHLNCEILLAEEGKKGIELMVQEEPSLILCDIFLPGLDGFDILNYFKKDYLAQHPYSLFIFLTGHEESRQKAFEAGVSGFIKKTELNYYSFSLEIRNLLRLVELERQQAALSAK